MSTVTMDISPMTSTTSAHPVAAPVDVAHELLAYRVVAAPVDEADAWQLLADLAICGTRCHAV